MKDRNDLPAHLAAVLPKSRAVSCFPEVCKVVDKWTIDLKGDLILSAAHEKKLVFSFSDAEACDMQNNRKRPTNFSISI